MLRLMRTKHRAEEDVLPEFMRPSKVRRVVETWDPTGMSTPNEPSEEVRDGCAQQALQGQDKAAKHNAAEVPIHLWNERVRENLSHLKLSDGDLNRLRQCLLACWKWRVGRDFG